MTRADRTTLPWALSLGLLASGCGPSSQEIGASILTTAPFVLLASSALLWTIWRPLDGAVGDYPWRILLRSSLISLIGPVIGVPILWETGDSETPLIALITYGTAVLTVAILVWHVLRLLKTSHPVERALLGVYLVLTLPAFPFLLTDEPTGHFHFVFLIVWLYAGVMGAVPGILMVLTWIGTAIRNANRRQSALPPA